GRPDLPPPTKEQPQPSPPCPSSLAHGCTYQQLLPGDRDGLVGILGCLCTVGVLTYGLISFQRGNTRHSQLMMRARIMAQGFTIVALLGGMAVTAMKSRK
uniref:HIG1 domain-containing protein n=1 Tax=Athene cunicularia TaxID=194338 RepID=A0A663MNR6_ATHCN